MVAYGEGDHVEHAQLSWPLGGGVMLGSADADDDLRWLGTFGAYVARDDPDGLHARAVAAGAEIVAGVYDTDYGSRDSAHDPEGNRWSFGTYRGEPVRQRVVSPDAGSPAADRAVTARAGEVRSVGGRLPLSTLLSQALVVFTIEFDNEAEERSVHSKHRPAARRPAHTAPG